MLFQNGNYEFYIILYTRFHINVIVNFSPVNNKYT